HVLVVPHQIPDHARAMVLDHEQDGTLVDADVVVVEPTDAWNDATARRAARAGEREVECIAEAVLTVEPRAERTVHLPECGNRDLGREGDGAARRGRCDRAVVADVTGCCAAGPVAVELAVATVHVRCESARPVAGGKAPDVLAVAVPAAGVRDRVRALRQRCAPRVLEVVDPATAHVRVLDTAEIDPD